MMSVSLKPRISLHFPMRFFLGKRRPAGNTRNLPWGAVWLLLLRGKVPGGKSRDYGLDAHGRRARVRCRSTRNQYHSFGAIFLEQIRCARHIVLVHTRYCSIFPPHKEFSWENSSTTTLIPSCGTLLHSASPETLLVRSGWLFARRARSRGPPRGVLPVIPRHLSSFQS